MANTLQQHRRDEDENAKLSLLVCVRVNHLRTELRWGRMHNFRPAVYVWYLWRRAQASIEEQLGELGSQKMAASILNGWKSLSEGLARSVFRGLPWYMPPMVLYLEKVESI